MSFGLVLAFVLTGCGNQGSDNNSGEQSPKQSQDKSNNQTATGDRPNKTHGQFKNLKRYSKDKDKNDPSEGDFDVVGQYLTETKDALVLNINGDHVAIKKKSSFHKKKKGLKDSLKGKQVDVEVSTKNQHAESLEPTPKTLANQEGIYERKNEGKGYKMIGKLVKNDENAITVKIPKGNKTYRKSGDFDMDNSAKGKNLRGKMVRLEIDKHGKAEGLDYSGIDQE